MLVYRRVDEVNVTTSRPETHKYRACAVFEITYSRATASNRCRVFRDRQIGNPGLQDLVR